MTATGEPQSIASALLSIAYWGKDWRWAQSELMRFHEHSDAHVRRMCALGFGHVARVNGMLDTEMVEPLLRRMARSENAPPEVLVAGTAEDALEDIEIFVHRPRRRKLAQLVSQAKRNRR